MLLLLLFPNREMTRQQQLIHHTVEHQHQDHHQHIQVVKGCRWPISVCSLLLCLPQSLCQLADAPETKAFLQLVNGECTCVCPKGSNYAHGHCCEDNQVWTNGHCRPPSIGECDEVFTFTFLEIKLIETFSSMSVLEGPTVKL